MAMHHHHPAQRAIPLKQAEQSFTDMPAILGSPFCSLLGDPAEGRMHAELGNLKLRWISESCLFFGFLDTGHGLSQLVTALPWVSSKVSSNMLGYTLRVLQGEGSQAIGSGSQGFVLIFAVACHASGSFAMCAVPAKPT